MIQIDIHQLQAELPRYIEQVAGGETIVVTIDDEPIAEVLTRDRASENTPSAQDWGEVPA